MPTEIVRDRRPHTAAVRLRQALESLAGALAHVQLDGLLTSEARLADVLSEVSRALPDHDSDRRATARELARARATLMRCRRLGSTLGDIVRISMAAQGGFQGYGRSVDPQRVRHSVEAKV